MATLAHIVFAILLSLVLRKEILALEVRGEVGSYTPEGTFGNGFKEIIHLILDPVSWHDAKATCEANNWGLYSYTNCLGCDVIQQLITHYTQEVGISTTQADIWFGAVRPISDPYWFKYNTCIPLDVSIEHTNPNSALDQCAAMEIEIVEVTLRSHSCQKKIPLACIETTNIICDFEEHDREAINSTNTIVRGHVNNYTDTSTSNICKDSCLADPYCLGATYDRHSTFPPCLRVIKPPAVTSYMITLDAAGNSVRSYIKRCKNVTVSSVSTVTSATDSISCALFTPTPTPGPTAATGNPSIATTTTVALPTGPTTPPLPFTMDACVCFNGTSLNEADLKDVIAGFEELKNLDPKSTGASIRTRESAPDKRGSSTALGSFAVIIILTVLGLICLPDVISIYRLAVTNMNAGN